VLISPRAWDRGILRALEADIPLLLPSLVLVEKVGGQLRYRLVGSAIAHAAGYDPTGRAVGSYIPVPETAAEVLAVFGRVFTAASPVFATGEYFHKTGSHIGLSLLSVPLSADGRVVNMSLSTVVARFGAALAPELGWLGGLPVKVSDVIDVSNLAELRKLCLEWERRSVPPSDGRLGKRAGFGHGPDEGLLRRRWGPFRRIQEQHQCFIRAKLRLHLLHR
jgi:hypothetical protein